MRKFIVAAIQLDTKDNKEENMKNLIGFIKEAISRGAKLIAMPEQINYVGDKTLENAEDIPGGETFNVMSEIAKKHKVWLHCGSMYEISSDKRPHNTTMLINPDGELAGKYRKIHTFDVDIKEGPSVKESDRVFPGSEIVNVDTKEVGNLGLSICYDIRFGEIFRIMALRGAQIFLTPADFTLNTGKDHWEPILRTRAIENGCYVIAPGQCGIKPKFHSYGKSLIVDPWGNVIAKASDKPCVITAEIDLDYLDSIRRQVLTLENRREDVYSIEAK